jgi:flagellar protein FliS
MANNGAASSYQQASANGASPVGLVVSLYDTILRDFRRALAAIDAGNVESRVFELNHSLTVVAHLQSVLNHEAGGQAAARLASFYNVTRAMILEANVQTSREAIQKLIELYTSLRQAWQQVEQQQPAAQQLPPTATTAPNTPVAPVAASVEDSAPRGRWSA